MDGVLDTWARDDRRRPLLIRGARQVGKTYAVTALGERSSSGSPPAPAAAAANRWALRPLSAHRRPVPERQVRPRRLPRQVGHVLGAVALAWVISSTRTESQPRHRAARIPCQTWQSYPHIQSRSRSTASVAAGRPCSRSGAAGCVPAALPQLALQVHDVVTIYRDDRYFTKNPDIVLLPGGKLLCVFNETDYHWPTEFSRITVIESGDYGATWGNPRIVDQAYRRRGEERWVTPRISRLRDGRLVIVCDQNDYQHCHESQPAGICAWWSEDDGDTWSS